MDQISSSHVPNIVIPCTSQNQPGDPTRRQGSKVCGGSYGQIAFHTNATRSDRASANMKHEAPQTGIGIEQLSSLPPHTAQP